MNFSSLLGILAAFGVLVGGVTSSTSGMEVLLNEHGILIVVGGTLAASLISFPLQDFWKLIKAFLYKVLLGKGDKPADVIQEIVNLSDGYRKDPSYLKSRLPSIKNPFLADAIDMLVKGGLKPEDVRNIMEVRAHTLFHRYDEEASIFKTIAKFPPAFGLMGTTLGMIGLMQSIGSEDAFEKIGPTMGVALVATLYGVAIANLIFIPLGENIGRLNNQEDTLRSIIIEGVELISRRSHPVLVEEKLKSYLLPSERPKSNYDVGRRAA
jgi:chemotaxis protein MotA